LALLILKIMSTLDESHFPIKNLMKYYAVMTMKESLFKNWSVTEVTLADIANLDLYQFTKKFRADKPVLLLTLIHK